MKRSEAISHAEQYFDSGEFKRTLARRIAVPTESQNDARGQALMDYLASRRLNVYSAGVPSKCWPSRPATRTRRATPFRRVRGRDASFAP